ncbi:DUF1906 domain-containing protein [Virgibacillus sp. AGTR]|uniref:glycoside hydrolase domain-containing protein n=1 Tax=Virgibacillus sp. AGTR TaxID=2812055 RepID=UPI001D162421|nr:glycoside hydrolase domain-containing protein [Virgibacillus sp. AGTR]MCC2252096.1 DUF1906 domain-containing protein [Virgibacillus sp. AGTR]
MDKMVLEVQKWLNKTYTGKTGYTPIPEDGRTGNTTVDALIIGLQIEIGIDSPVPNFGPSTREKFPGLSRQDNNEEPTNLNRILQGGFWCKGYNPGGFTGNFFGHTEDKVKEFETHVGLNPTGYVDAKLMEAILNTDGFKQSDGYPSYIRTMQQLLNRNYSKYFDYIPTNGIYERKTNKAIIYALQHEIGIGHIANGHYGPSTQSNTPTLRLGNENREQNRILQFALAANGYYQTGLYDGNYGESVESAVREFQEFMTLPANGVADMPTIKQLLTSNGYTGRVAIACDASTVINQTTANTLLNYNYQIIGRYLTGYVGTGAERRSKAMTQEELNVLAVNGIRVFPIYQDGGWYAEYFNYERGFSDGLRATEAAERLGFPYGTTIYFAVDFDAYDFEVTNLILPYLRGVKQALNSTAGESGLNKYKLGVYGPRNICIRAYGDSIVNAEHSFVANMSTGFSGNLGYPMPTNWSFSQFYETTIADGISGSLRIDKNDYSGRDTGVSSVNPPSEENPVRKKLYDEMLDLGGCLSGFFSDPNAFGAKFNFNERIKVFDTLLYKIYIEAETSYELNSDANKVIQVTDSNVSYNIKDLIGSDLYGNLSAGRIKDYKRQLDDLAITIGNGWIEFSSDITSTVHTIKITAYKDKIEVDGQAVELAVSVIHEYYTNTGAPEYTPVREIIEKAEWVALGLAAARLAIRIPAYTNPVVGTIALLVSFIIGAADADDVLEEDE